MSEETNFAEFEQQAGGAEEVVTEAVEEVVEEGGEEAVAETEDAPEAPKPKPKQTAQERIDEVTAARREAERDAKYWRDVAMGRVKPNGGPPQEAEAKPPNADDFDMGESDPKYLDALVDFRVEKGLDKLRGTMAQDMHVQAQERVWEASQGAARSEFADYDAKVIDGAHNWPCTPDMAEAIRTSDAGGRIAYRLASNPDEARRIAALPIHAQVREIGKIEASLETPKPATAKTTSAPKPPETQARGAGGQFAPSAATTNFAEFEAMANRKT